MWDLLNPLVSWLGATPFALWVGQSTNRIAWLFVFHLFGLVLLLGGTIVLSLRLLGVALRQVPEQVLARTVLPISSSGLLLMVASGFIIFSGGAESYYVGSWFRLKMILLVIAVVFHFTVFRAVLKADTGRHNPLVRSGVAIFALLIWFGVGWAGRAIAFF